MWGHKEKTAVYKPRRETSEETLCNPMDYTIHRLLWARILEWVAFPFSRGSSQHRDWTQVSHIADEFFTSWVTREAPRILEWVAYPFSRGFSQLGNRTRVSCVAGGFFTSWAIREDLHLYKDEYNPRWIHDYMIRKYQMILSHLSFGFKIN